MSGYKELLEVCSYWASIATAAVAVFAYFKYLWERSDKRRRLETYLKAEKASGQDKGQRTIMHLAAKLKLTKKDIMDAAFRSKNISVRVSADGEGYAGKMLLEYIEP